MNAKAMFSSATDEWSTPQQLFDDLNREFRFDVDTCAGGDNYKLPEYYCKEQDGLSQDWCKFKSCWMNPPYGREVGKWVKKAYEESKKGCTVVCLLPARTDIRWFHDYIYNKAEVRFIKGRLRFGDAKIAIVKNVQVKKCRRNYK